MHLRYQTGIGTLIQFIVLSLLGIPNALVSIIATCHGSNSGGGQCLSNGLVSVVFFLFTAVWFGFLWMLGYIAQERRSKRLAYLLICCEALTALVALFNARHDTNFLTTGTSFLDLALAVWIVFLAIRLSRSKGRRIMSTERARKRRNTPTLPL